MGNTLPETRRVDIHHRKQYEKFVMENGDPTVSKLIHLWNYWNTRFFDKSFKAPPIILLAEPSRPSVLGDYSAVGAYGNRAQIRIRPSLLSGTHPHMLPGEEYMKGRFLFVADVCLHETIHLWQDEVIGDLEDSYHGHGPLFRDKCNEIGEKLGLPPVRTCKKRGLDAKLPSCSQFPHNVRPAKYYQGAYVREDNSPRPLRGRLERLLKDYTGEEIVQELRGMGIITRHEYGGQEDLSAVGITDEVPIEGESPPLKHQWFVDVFQTACHERGISPDLILPPSVRSTLDAWIDEKLTRGSHFGRNFFAHERQSTLTEKLGEIISQWDFIEISDITGSIQIPSAPDLAFVVRNREALFGWISDQRRRLTGSALEQLGIMSDDVPYAEYRP